ncbi:MAG: hypothetical protein U0271_35235 [Polyangiaceae bacterium]
MVDPYDGVIGMEFDWLAIDPARHVGFFASAGRGCIPMLLLPERRKLQWAIECLMALPVRTTALYAPVIAPHLSNDWQLLAERGIYAFDAGREDADDHLEAEPRDPLCLDALPGVIANVAQIVVLATAQFSSQRRIAHSSLARWCKRPHECT